jgi:flavin-dependent dehydrogenase
VTIKNTTTVFKGKVIIGADGAQSTVARQLTEKSIDRKHYLGAVRAYYSDVQGVKDDVSEVFFNTKFQLNYFWVFPIKGNLANVGFGMLSSHISEKKVNLKDTFYQYLKESPELTEKFRNAQAVSPLEGFGVPLGSNVGVTSGQRFMLIGDAASLSNPISGTGMGNAVLSGKLAAEQVERCFKSNDFSQTSMKQYDEAIQKAIIDELMSSFKAQRILGRMPFLLDIVFWLSKYKRVKTMIQKIV